LPAGGSTLWLEFSEFNLKAIPEKASTSSHPQLCCACFIMDACILQNMNAPRFFIHRSRIVELWDTPVVVCGRAVTQRTQNSDETYWPNEASRVLACGAILSVVRIIHESTASLILSALKKTTSAQTQKTYATKIVFRLAIWGK